VRSKFLREDTTDALVVSTFRCRDRKGKITVPLEIVCYPDSDLIEHLVNDVIAVVPVQYRPCLIPVLQEVDKAVLQHNPGNNRTRELCDLITALLTNVIPCGAKIRNAKIISAQKESKGLDAGTGIRKHLRVHLASGAFDFGGRSPGSMTESARKDSRKAGIISPLSSGR
jgi:hypothetical protein